MITLTGFHGTDREINGKFHPFTWFHALSEGADFYYSGDDCGRKYEASVLFENPLQVSREEFIASCHGPTWWRDKAAFCGHDGVIIHDITDGDTFGDVFCAFDPDSITIKP